ncbi:beta-N-acetylhexosaminidase [Desulfolithobacter sp.]
MVGSVLERSSLGQMFMVGFDGCRLDEDHSLREVIEQQRVGGVILFDRNVDGRRQNIRSPAQLKALTASLHDLAPDYLLVAVDQEGGRVCRLKEKDGFLPSCTAAELGCHKADPHGPVLAMAMELREMGINLNLAPVVDLDIYPKNPIIGQHGRSFGADPDLVVARARAFIQAHHRAGVACALKHFPGHGSSRGDTHLGFVDVTDTWQEKELDPFARLIDLGLADCVMTAHVVNRRLDPDGLPATLSAPILTGLLRQRLGFDGVVVSDDLQMGAITGQWSYREAVQRAVLAGVDLLIVGNNLIRQLDAVAEGVLAIEELLDRGKLDVARISRSLGRIEQLKKNIQERFHGAETANP